MFLRGSLHQDRATGGGSGGARQKPAAETVTRPSRKFCERLGERGKNSRGKNAANTAASKNGAGGKSRGRTKHPPKATAGQWRA